MLRIVSSALKPVPAHSSQANSPARSMKRRDRALFTSLGLLPSLALLGLTLSGFGMGKNLAGSSDVTKGAAMQGHVHGGQQPVVGATVTFYAAGNSGYGSTPVVLDTTTTDSGGSFSLTGSYTCPAAPGDQVYLVATGGNPGGGVNACLALMAGLGTCSNLTSSTLIDIDEVTTVAAAYALAPFMTTQPNVGTSAANYQGLVNAFDTIGNLVDTTDGTALTITPAYAASSVPGLNTSTVPQSRINTLADILAACVNSTATGGNGTACTTLFTAATPPGGTPPADTLQAALNIAQNPGNNVSTLFGLSSGTSPFQPSLGAAPTDWQIAITYTGAGLGVPSSGTIQNTALAIDAAGDPWVTAYGFSGGTVVANSGMIAEFSPLGAPLTPATTVSTASPPVTTYGGYQLATAFMNSGPQPIVLAFDESGNAWISSSGAQPSIDAITPGLMPLLSAPAPDPQIGGSTQIPQNLAIDESGKIWLAAQQVVAEYNSAGTQLLISSGGGAYGNGYYGGVLNLTFDSTGNNLWASDGTYDDFYLINAGTTDQLSNDYYPTGGTFTALAAGAGGNIYACPGGTSSIMVFNASSTSGSVNTYPSSTGRGCGNQMAIDGLGNVWVLSSVLDEYSSTGTLLSPSAGYTATSSAESPVFPETTSSNGIAIDGSGNLWILNGSGTYAGSTINTLAEVVGTAAPVVTPVSQALSFGEIATRP